jgi:hypothetical protein
MTGSRGFLRVTGPIAAPVLALSFVFALVACSQQPVYLPSHDFDRPTDVAFTCLEVAADPAATPVAAIAGGQPMDVCHPSGADDPLIGKPFVDGNTYKTYAFVTNSGQGDVTVVDMSYCRSDDGNCLDKSLQPGASLVDLDPNSIGYGSVPVGRFPEVIDASQDGCRVVTANRGSCDLTLINPAALLSPKLVGSALAPDYAKTFMVRTGSGTPLAVAPGEVAFVPQQTNLAELRGPATLCTADGTLAAPVGDPPATPTSRASWHAVVTFPSCDLIALVDLMSETILDSFQVSSPDGSSYAYTHTGAEPTCARIDCGVGAGTFPDAGAGGAGGAGGGAPGTGVPLDVQPIAIRPEGTRVYFGATNAPVVGALDIVGDTLAEPALGTSTPIANAGGVVRLRLSVDPFSYVNGHLPKAADGTDPNDPTKPELGRFVARTDVTELQYLYAIGRDASIRIVDVSRPEPTECDVGIDPTAVDPADPRRKCFPVNATDNPPRLPQIPYLAGLHFPSPPQDVAFAYYWSAPVDPTATAVNEQILNGAFAFVLTGGGGVYVINVDPTPRQTQQVYYGDPNDQAMPKALVSAIQPQPPNSAGLVLAAGAQTEAPLPLPNTPRDANVITFSSGLLPQVGPPRVDTALPITTSSGPVLGTFLATTTRENASIIPFLQNGVATPPGVPVQTYVYFPNRATVLPQTWSIQWEGDLTGVRNAGDLDLVRTRGVNDPNGLALAITDYGASFCSAGIFPGDIVTLTGCSVDGNCGPGRVCVHNPDAPSSASGYPINGLCMTTTDAANPAVLDECSDLLGSFRRYEISAELSQFGDSGQPQSTIVIVPKKSEIPVITPCDPAVAHACQPEGRPDLAGFSCVNGRCLIECETADMKTGELTGTPGICAQRRGSVCVDFRATDGHFFCADGAPLPGRTESCGFDQLFPYSIAAGKSFVVVGTAAGRTDPGTSLELPLAAAGGAGGVGGAGGLAGAGGAGGAGAGTGGNGGGSGQWQCARDPSASPNLVARIPLDLARCTAPQLTMFNPGTDVNGKPALVPSSDQYRAIFTDSTLPIPNPCLIEFGPSTSGSSGAGGAGGVSGQPAGPTYSALFQNREIRFILTNLETLVGDAVQIRFGVDGGMVGQTVAVGADSSIGLPARIKVGPVPAFDQTMPLTVPGDTAFPSDMPFLYVIDQRTSATGRAATRGQLLRIAPRLSDTSPVPSYQSAVDSNSYFPIQ